MLHPISRMSLPLLTAAIFAVAANSAEIPIGTVNFNLTGLPGTATIDIANQTGPNSSTFPDATFPVSSSVSLSNLSLTLDFSSGPAQTFGASYFNATPDGLSFDGNTISITTPVMEAILSGNFATTSLTLNDGTSFTASPDFTASITDSTGTLADGDFAILYASPSGSMANTPEPGAWRLLGLGLIGLLIIGPLRSRNIKNLSSRNGVFAAALLPILLLIPHSSVAADASSVKLNAWTMPSSGISGTSLVWVTGSAFPAGAIAPSAVTISLQTSCGVTSGATSATASSVIPILGSAQKVQFQVPASLAAGPYFVSISGTTATGAAFTSSNCSAISVTHSSTAVGSCNPGSSMGMLVPSSTTGTTSVTAYVPNGYWTGGTTGLRVVPVEGSGSPASVSTPNVVNSCSTDSVLGKTICTANTTDIYVITGSGLSSTLTSGSNAFARFSGGTCKNCDVAVNAVTHQAAITMGFNTSNALQFLDLNTQALSAPVPTSKAVSEDVLWDPFLNLILSPNETHAYDLFKISGSGLPGTSAISEYSNPVTDDTSRGEYDSAGEDCTTGIALASDEAAGGIYIVDLTQATYTSGSPGAWKAPGQSTGLPELYFAAATDGIAVAPGSTHLGIVAGEFGGNGFGVIQLPSTSGTGVPKLVDYVAARLPKLPSGGAFATGYDPHTTTAYTSPNNEKAYGVMADWSTGAPAYLAIIDLQALLNAPRSAAHTLDPTYDLLAKGVVRYVATK